MSRLTYLGKTTGRRRYVFGMRDADRLLHSYVIGATGSGKTSLLESMATQDVARGHGVIVLDPHGDLARRLVRKPDMLRKLIHIDVADPNCSYGFNPVQGVIPALVPLVVSGMMDSLKSLFSDAWGTRMEGVLRAALYAIVEAGNGTLPDVLRILHDSEYRRDVTERITNEEVKRYWRYEFPSIHPRLRAEMILPIQTKISALLCDPRLQALFTRTQNVLRFRKLMDEQKTVIIDLSKGRLGVDSASLIGSLMLTAITMAALSRANVAETQRPLVMVYLDECHLLTTETVAEMVSELRKYGIGLVLAHQVTTQFGGEVRRIVLGTVGSVFVFRTGLEDAEYFAAKLGKPITARDLMNLPARNAYAQMLVDGTLANTFSFETLPLPETSSQNN